MLELHKALYDIFEGSRRAHGVFNVNLHTTGLKQQGVAKTIKTAGPTKDNWRAHLEGKSGLGIIPINEENQVRWGAIDIDTYSLDIPELVKKIDSYKLPLVVCRSKSGGAHVFCFVDNFIPAGDMQDKLRELAAGLGYGGVEIFPKQREVLVDRGDIGSWLNMPYFEGEDSVRYGHNPNGVALTPEEFVVFVRSQTITHDQLLELKVPEVDDIKGGPPCLKILLKQGFPEGTRNNGLFNVGVFLRKKFPDDWEKRLEDVNIKYMQPPLGAQEVLTVGKQVQRKDYFYKCNDQPIASHCNSPLCRTRKYGIGANDGTPLFSNLTKQDSEPPIWFLDVEGGRLELETDDLLNQNRFQRKCMDALNKIPQKVKENVWRQIIQQLLDALTVVEVPKESSTEGHFLELLENFCTERPARERDELLLHKPWTDNGKTYFRLGDLMEYLHRHNFKDYQRNNLTSKLKQLHGEPHFFNIKGRGVNVWYIEEFKAQDEPHDLPDFNDNLL